MFGDVLEAAPSGAVSSGGEVIVMLVSMVTFIGSGGLSVKCLSSDVTLNMSDMVVRAPARTSIGNELLLWVTMVSDFLPIPTLSRIS